MSRLGGRTPARRTVPLIEREAAHPGRFLLGLGVGHAELAEQFRRLYAAMVDHLDALDPAGVPTERRVLAALGPGCSASPATGRRAAIRTW